jgi:tetratricopeptide (TPR) repeat protein
MTLIFSRPSLSELLSEYRGLRSDLIEGNNEGKACRFKFSNNGEGISEQKQKAISAYIKEIYQGKYDEADEPVLIDLVLLLTIYSNHLDQQTTDQKNPKLPLTLKEKKVLKWLEAAAFVAQKIIPFDKLLNEDLLPQLAEEKSEALSAIAMMLHYLGKARRYDKTINIEQRFPLLITALNISKCKLTNDPQYFDSRTSTYEMPLIYCLRDMNRQDEAAAIVKEQLKVSIKTNNYFHVIQGNVQLSEIYREKHENTGTGIEESIKYAQEAIDCVLDSAKIEGEQDFTHHILHFNAKTALMKAYSTNEQHEEAKEIADSIISENEVDSNCGAKKHHLDAAQNVLDVSTRPVTNPF